MNKWDMKKPWNKAVLMRRHGRFRFVPASGPCPKQVLAFCTKIVKNATYGKFGAAPTEKLVAKIRHRFLEHLERNGAVFYTDTDAVEEERKRMLVEGTYEEPRVEVAERKAYYGTIREFLIKPRPRKPGDPKVVYYDISSSYPASMLEAPKAEGAP